MTKWILAAIWVTGAALGQTTATVAVLAGFEGAPSAAVSEFMRTELSALYEPAGLSLEWYDLNTPSDLGRPAAVVAVRFTGSCRWDLTKPWRSAVGPLAWTAQVDGELQPHITVDCSRIAAFAQAPSPGLLGRALGRVLAHELYHYLTQQTDHTHTLLFRESVSPSDLLMPAVGFDRAELEALRAAPLIAD